MCAYAYTTIDSSTERKVALGIGSDDGIKIWCNSELLWTSHEHRPINPNEEAVILPLRRGKNHLLVKIEQGTGGWGFRLDARSAEKEAPKWASAPGRAYDLNLFNPGPTSGAAPWVIVGTSPAYAMSEKVTVRVRNAERQTIGETRVDTGEPVSLPIPDEYRGIYYVQAEHTERPETCKSAVEIGIAGDADQVTAEAIKRARERASTIPTTNESENIEATLNLMAERLEGNNLPGITAEERYRAIMTITNVCNTLDENGS